jgi:GNAT superfamily N-acetyltransferase
VHGWLSTGASWAIGRSRGVQDAAIDASLNFGLYDGDTGTQLAYARVVTDGVTFAWLCDVIVDPAARGRGLGVTLINNVVTHLDGLNLKRVVLATGDAHELYRKFGFAEFADAQKWMARVPGASA